MRIGSVKLTNWRAAKVVWQDMPLAACYVLVEEGALVLDETGDYGVIPGGMFRPVGKPKSLPYI